VGRSANAGARAPGDSSLVDPTPRDAIVKRGLEHRAARDVAVGDVVVVRPGDKVPLDGRIGLAAATQQAPMTGESLPVDKGQGRGRAGTINGRGALEPGSPRRP
jgi:Cd2+/Zn2+-exporting ATPase